MSLARAIYEEAEIYLLDDPLAAVDAKTANSLYNNCINGFLASKTRVLITHRISFLQNSENIILIENGKVSDTGSYEKLRNAGHKFLEKFHNQTETDDQPVTNETSSKIDLDRKAIEENKETKKDGEIGWRNLWRYIKMSNSIPTFIIFVILKLAAVPVYVTADIVYSLIVMV